MGRNSGRYAQGGGGERGGDGVCLGPSYIFGNTTTTTTNLIMYKLLYAN